MVEVVAERGPEGGLHRRVRRWRFPLGCAASTGFVLILGAGCQGGASLPPAIVDTEDEAPVQVTPLPADLGLRPLTRRELDHAVQDLLGVELSPSLDLPEPVRQGYATDVAAGSLDDTLVQAMFEASGKVAASFADAAPQHAITVQFEDLDVPWEGSLDSAGSDAASWVISRIVREVRIPVHLEVGGAWEAAFRVGFLRLDGGGGSDPNDPIELVLTLDGAPLDPVRFSVYGTEAPPAVVRFTAEAGPHELVLVSRTDAARTPIFDAVRLTPAGGGPRLIEQVAACPADAAEALVACVAELLEPVARRAWRRPVDAARGEALRAVLSREAAAGGSAAEVLQQGLHAVLASPEFWLVAEGAEGSVAGSRYLLGPYEVATRLALLLWESVPDEALLDCAASGGLVAEQEGPCGLSAQVDRMLQDARATRVVGGFAWAWLALARLDHLTVDPTAWPEVDADLKASMQEETRLVLEEILLGAGSLDALLATDFTWVDRRLAAHYGLPAPSGLGFQRVAVDPAERGGVLRAGAVLLSTAHPVRVSDVRRGALTLSAFACAPSDPPPADVSLVDVVPGEERAALVAQTASPPCLSCHANLNPWGFALSAYDYAGRYEPAGYVTLPPDAYATQFASVGSLLDLLRANDLATRCFSRHLTSWAVGRSLQGLSPAELGAVEQAMLEGGGTFRAALLAVVGSPLFLSRPMEAP